MKRARKGKIRNGHPTIKLTPENITEAGSTQMSTGQHTLPSIEKEHLLKSPTWKNHIRSVYVLYNVTDLLFY